MNKQLGAIRSTEVAAYLQAKGWKRRTSYCEEKASLWLAPAGGGDTDVLLPLRDSLDDYALRMGDLLRGVAQVEGRSPTEVLHDLATAAADVIRVRVITGEGSGNTLPFLQGLTLIKRIRDVVVAAARSAVEKRAFFSNRPSETIFEFMEQLQLGQTEQGSFVFTVISPVPAGNATAPHAGEPETEPFERRVTITLMQALQAMEQAAHIAATEGSIDPFRKAVENGVSANLCDAVVGLKSVSPDSLIEFSMTWASMREPSVTVPSRVVLRPESSPFIEAASDAFWGMPKAYDVKLEGTFIELESHESALSGSVVVMAYVDGHARPIHAHFDAPDFTEVVRAYKERLIVKCEGDLVKEGGVLILKNARHFQIIDPRTRRSS